MADKIAGTTYVNIDGAVISVKGSITCSFWDTEREVVLGIDGPHGYKEMYVAPFVEVTASATKELDLNLIQQISNSTIQVEMANGKSGVLSGATLVNQPEINPEEGEVTLRFEGKSGSYS